MSAADSFPAHVLHSFVMRMAFNGQCVNGRLMQGDPLYALRRLADAHASEDSELQELALGMFRHFERQRSGVLAH